MTAASRDRKQSLRQRALALMGASEARLRAQLAAHYAAIERMRSHGEAKGDVVDLAFARGQAEVEHELIDRIVREIRAIERARARIDEGSYGVCADCSAQIDWSRLEINPAALRCADCQSRREREGAGDGNGRRAR